MDSDRINVQVEEALRSLDGINRAEPRPFLLTRLRAAIHTGSPTQNGWNRAAAFISRPAVFTAGLLVILTVNICILKYKEPVTTGSDQGQAVSIADDFAINNVAMYDIENLEQQ